MACAARKCRGEWGRLGTGARTRIGGRPWSSMVVIGGEPGMLLSANSVSSLTGARWREPLRLWVEPLLGVPVSEWRPRRAESDKTEGEAEVDAVVDVEVVEF